MRALVIQPVSSGLALGTSAELLHQALRGLTGVVDQWGDIDPGDLYFNLAEADIVILPGTEPDSGSMRFLDAIIQTTDIGVLVITHEPERYRSVAKQGHRIAVVDQNNGSQGYPLQVQVRAAWNILPRKPLPNFIFEVGQRKQNVARFDPKASGWLALGRREGRKVLWRDRIYVVEHDLDIQGLESPLRILIVKRLVLTATSQTDPQKIEIYPEVWKRTHFHGILAHLTDRQ